MRDERVALLPAWISFPGLPIIFTISLFTILSQNWNRLGFHKRLKRAVTCTSPTCKAQLVSMLANLVQINHLVSSSHNLERLTRWYMEVPPPQLHLPPEWGLPLQSQSRPPARQKHRAASTLLQKYFFQALDDLSGRGSAGNSHSYCIVMISDILHQNFVNSRPIFMK